MLPCSMVKVVELEYSRLIFQSNLCSLMQSTWLLLCVGIADVYFFLWLLCASTYFENLEFLTFNSTVNEQLILQLSLVILSSYCCLLSVRVIGCFTRRDVLLYVHGKISFW